MRLVEPTIPEGIPVEERRQAHVTALLPIIGFVFVAYLVIGLDEWKKRDYRPDILSHREKLYKKLGYTM